MGGAEHPADGARRERSALAGSAAVAGVLGTLGVVWGLLAGSGVILFDGVYTLAGIALVAVSFLASRAARSSPSDRYPFGRHAATPLAVAMQGTALLATLVYGAADAAGTLLAGGSDGDPTSLIGYGVVTASVCAVAAVALRRTAPDSELVHAEVVSWRAGAWLSVVVALGGVAGRLLQDAGQPVAAGYVDPVLLVLAVVLVGPLPVRLVRSGMHELLEGAPPPDVEVEIARVVAAARAEHGLPEAVVRATKLGRRLYVEVDFVVATGSGWDVDAEDVVRHAVVDPLQLLPYDVWATVDITADRDLTL